MPIIGRMFARCLGIEGKVNIFLLLGEAAELNVQGEGLEFDAFHSGGRGVVRV